MTDILNVDRSKEVYKERTYGDLAGVDFSSIPSYTALNRSNDAKNIYKNYRDTAGQAIETRPGYVSMGTVGDDIYGLHIIGTKCLIHYGTNLAWWETFPNAITGAGDLTVLFTTMAQVFSTSFVYNGLLYILDGTNYLVYNGTTAVAVTGFIPTTSTGADPNGANRSIFQGVNYLSSYRKNSFVGDGTSTVFTLDVSSYDNETPTATVNGASASIASFSYTTGTVTFTAAPAAPSTAGEDNVIITFKKAVSGYPETVKNCTIATIFDTRVIISGNANKKGYFYPSELDDPTYFSDTKYVKDTDEDDSAIVALIPSTDAILSIHDNSGKGTKVFYHVPTIDSTDGKIYPVTETSISKGCVSQGINFFDDVVYLSSDGLESVYLSSDTSYLIHRSTLIDKEFINEANYSTAKIEIWNNYLMVLVNNKVYLADSRQINKIDGHREYEWYYWDNINGTLLKDYNGTLFLSDASGNIFKFSGYNDNGTAINAYWVTPLDIFDSRTKLKTALKRGGVAEIKTIANSVIKVDVATDKESFVNILTSSQGGFSFANINFASFTFGTSNRTRIVYNPKKKKWIEIQLKFYSDVLDKPFGLYNATLRALIGNDIKRV